MQRNALEGEERVALVCLALTQVFLGIYDSQKAFAS